MYAEKTHWNKLPKGTPARAIAKIATIANSNTIHGGCSAMRKSDRALAMGLPSAGEMADAVSATYGASSGNPSPEHRAWACGECGCVHLGITAAQNCCGSDDECCGD